MLVGQQRDNSGKWGDFLFVGNASRHGIEGLTNPVEDFSRKALAFLSVPVLNCLMIPIPDNQSM